MEKPKARLLVSLFAYGGNGGIAGMSPDLALWWAKTYHEIKLNPLIDFLGAKVYSDTPITLTRCKAVEDAKALGADMILMLDSDNVPDGYLGVDPQAVPFFPTAFTFAHERLLKGVPTVIAAPYCGPPPPPVDEPGTENMGEVPYLFEWGNKESDDPNTNHKLLLLTRNQAARLAGIYPVAALPTGVCLFTLNAFEGLKQPYFRYEMDATGSRKNSTEDVVATRDISLFWKIAKGYDVLFAACDSWAFHVKTKKVGRPRHTPIEAISEDFADAIRRHWSAKDEVRSVDFTAGLGAVEKTANVPTVKKAINPPVEAPAAPKRNYVLHGDTTDLAPPPEDISRIPNQYQELGPNDNYVRISAEDWAVMEAESPAPVAVEETHKSNGHALRSKMVGSRKVAILDYEVADDTVGHIQSLTNWLVGKLEGGIEVAVVHPGTGQGTAAIVSCLPALSRVLAFDSVSQYATDEYAKHFTRTFEKEMDSGLVKADVDGKRFPSAKNYQVDMVFIENFVTAGKLDAWLKAVSPKGVLCGLGYTDPATAALVEVLRQKHALPIQVMGDLWAIPVGGIANAGRID